MQARLLEVVLKHGKDTEVVGLCHIPRSALTVINDH